MSCEKSFTIQITPAVSPQAWWTLNQATGSLVEAITGTPMVLDVFGTGASFASVAGKVGNALQINLGTFDFASALSDPNADFAYQGTGFSMCFWLFAPPGSAAAGGTQLSYSGGTTGPNFFSFTVENLTNVTCDGAIEINGVSSGMTFPAIGAAIVNNAWNFFVFTYDGTTGEVKASINGSALASFGVFGATAATPGDPTATLGILQISAAVGVNDFRWDEIGIFASALDQSGVDFLYNGGAGKTYPF